MNRCLKCGCEINPISNSPYCFSCLISSLPRATPVLKGKDAKRFLCHIKENENKKIEPTPTPRIGLAIELIKRYKIKHSKDTKMKEMK